MVHTSEGVPSVRLLRKAMHGAYLIGHGVDAPLEEGNGAYISGRTVSANVEDGGIVRTS